MTADWISPFLEAQAAELNAAENTLLAYGRDLRDARDWLSARGHGFDTATRADIEAYLISLDTEGLARSTRARRLSSKLERNSRTSESDIPSRLSTIPTR